MSWVGDVFAGLGVTAQDHTFPGWRPLIGIACTASDLNRCDRGLRALAAAVRRGVQAAGGPPLGSGTGLWRLYDSRRSGSLDDAAWARLETGAATPSGRRPAVPRL
jgi:dihydroxyacid dehydratase/phosphogluconate dehydratase